jgi:hypothetical protein
LEKVSLKTLTQNFIIQLTVHVRSREGKQLILNRECQITEQHTIETGIREIREIKEMGRLK